ncbi:MAG: carbon-nitrogen hydrolase [Gammaproteobacteria bacterium]|nr:carbon-nitrogen hydrolase [Gammaproteobacteria bacterium]
MTKNLTVGLVQHTCCNDPQQNLTTSIHGIEQAAKNGAQLIVLPELHRNHYFCQTEDAGNFDLAEAIPGPTTTTLSVLAKQLKVVIIASLFERRAVGMYHNTAVVIDTDNGIAGIYRKMHIPDDPGYYEKYYFTPGDLGFTPVSTSIGKIGVLVCWDQWFPEAARIMALSGADMLVIPTAIGWDQQDVDAEKQRQYDAWITIQRAHAIANGLPIAVCNRTGHEPDPNGRSDGITFWGSSFVAGPQGELLTQCPSDKTLVQTTIANIERSEQVRRNWPYFRDRRIDAYRDILLRYRD